MEKTEQNGASAPRRRRRRRGSGKGGAQAAAQQAQRAPQGGAEKPAQKEGKKAAHSAAPHKEEAQPARSRHRGGQGRKTEGQGSARSAAPAREARQPHAPGSRHGARGGHAARHPAEEDPGLVLITRRPPKQKFANFEEYLAAHGGMTAPLPEEEAAAVPAGADA